MVMRRESAVCRDRQAEERKVTCYCRSTAHTKQGFTHFQDVLSPIPDDPKVLHGRVDVSGGTHARLQRCCILRLAWIVSGCIAHHLQRMRDSPVQLLRLICLAGTG